MEGRKGGKRRGRWLKLPRRAFITLVLKVTGNVNADIGIGTRIPLKKIITWDQQVKPFVSARCIRRCIRERLYEKGFEIDPLHLIGPRGREQLGDIGNPVKYIDDDLFGFLRPQEPPIKRSSPIKVSHLISLTHAEVKVEFAARFPREFLKEFEVAYPVPFEIELAEWLGKLNVIVSDRVGCFSDEELSSEAKKLLEEKYPEQKNALPTNERKERLGALLEVLLWEGWVFPRAAQGQGIPEFYYGILALTEHFIPISGYVDITEDGQLDQKKITTLSKFYEPLLHKLYILDYRAGSFKEIKGNESNALSAEKIKEIVQEVCDYIISAEP